MARPKKETHLFFEQGEDEIQIRSWDKDLNAAVRKLKVDEPDAVWIRENDDDEPGYLWAAVKRDHFAFRALRSQSPECRAAKAKAGKQHTGNLKHQKKE